MYGGNKMGHNPTCIIECHPAENPKDRYATLEKNRGNDLSVKYSIFHKKFISPESEKTVETTEENAPKLKFNIIERNK